MSLQRSDHQEARNSVTRAPSAVETAFRGVLHEPKSSTPSADIFVVSSFSSAHPLWSPFEYVPKPNPRSATAGTSIKSEKPTPIRWLTDKEMLPRIMPEARILGFGFRVEDQKVLKIKDIETAAGELCEYISTQRNAEGSQKRPVIFIGHFFGCVVIQNALSQKHGWKDAVKSSLTECQEALAGTLFFSYPEERNSEKNEFQRDDPMANYRAKISKDFDSISMSKGFFSVSFVAGKQRPSISSNHHSASAFASALTKSPALHRGSRSGAETKPNFGQDADTTAQEDTRKAAKTQSDRQDQNTAGLAQDPGRDRSAATSPTELDQPRVTLDKTSSDLAKFSGPGDPDYKQVIVRIQQYLDTASLLSAAASSRIDDILSRSKTRQSVNLQDRAGNSALHVMVRSVRNVTLDGVYRLVTECGVDVSLRNHEGRTALHVAVEVQEPGVVYMLLRLGANPEIEDNEQISPVTLNQECPENKKRSEIFEILENRPFTKGASRESEEPLGKRHPTGEAETACRNIKMTVTEIFNEDGEDYSLPPVSGSIYDFIYEDTMSDRLNEARERAENGGKDEYEVQVDRQAQQNAGDGSESETQPQLLGQLPGQAQDLARSESDIGSKDAICTWYHLPANNMSWVEDLFTRLQLQPPQWPGLDSTSLNIQSHRRSVPPCATSSGMGDQKISNLFMPYLSYENYKTQMQRKEYVREIEYWDWLFDRALTDTQDELDGWVASDGYTAEIELRKFGHEGKKKEDTWTYKFPYDITKDDTSDDLSKDERSLLIGYLGAKSPLHIRRTLDQSYYDMLPDTDHRDNDQVVTRWAQNQKPPERGHNVIMVDQLWLWIIRGDKKPDTVITAFPDRKSFQTSASDNLQATILNPSGKVRSPIVGTYDLVSQIVATCCSIFDKSQEVTLLQFQRIFEKTIAASADLETKLFRSFMNQTKALEIFQALDRASRRRWKDDGIFLSDCIFSIRETTKLVQELKDVRDEITIILHNLDEQLRVIESVRDLWRADPKTHEPPSTEIPCEKARQSLLENKRDFEKMKAQVGVTHKELHHLLNLKQKQANLLEARYAREQAEETEKQGTVMLVFTVVTVIFLPLSFLASFLALNVHEFPRNAQTGDISWPLRPVCAYIFGTSIGIALPVVLLACSANTTTAFWGYLVYSYLTRFLDLVRDRIILTVVRWKYTYRRSRSNLSDPEREDLLQILSSRNILSKLKRRRQQTDDSEQGE